MYKHLSSFFFLCLLTGTTLAQRNVILIIADDLGTDYCGYYENHLDTVAMPNIRRLLSRGVRFKNAWSNPLCSPTRAGILTGRYSFRTGVGDAVGGVGSAVLDTSELTIPRMLQYFQPGAIAKANIGKWHLQLPNPVSNYYFPNKMGYDHFEGNFSGVLNSYTNWTKVTNGVASNVTNYATTETANNAIAWVKKQKMPFFLWLAFNAPHAPFHLPPTDLHSYKSLSGTPADISANPKPYFKAAVEAMDHEIGRLFDSLLVYKQFDNTDIIFIGDNGDDSYVAQNKGSAKGSIYQEGISVPFIISGPSIVNPGRISDALVNTHDLFATILELFGFDKWRSKISSSKPVDSKSILPILKNIQKEIRDWTFSEVFKNIAVAGDGKTMRNAKYKLLDFDNGTQKFFNLAIDPMENMDLLKMPLKPEAATAYYYLCNEMNKLLSMNRFCDITATGEIPVDEQIEVFPNPAKEELTFRNADDDTPLLLVNSLGQVVIIGKELIEQEFRHLPTSIYFLQCSGRYPQVIRLVKQ